MKIGIINSTSSIGGTELSSMRICKLLQDRGEDVVLIAPGNSLQKEMEGIRYIAYSFSRRNPAVFFHAIKTLAKIFREEEIDIAHCQDAASCILCCYVKKYYGSKIRLVWHERSISFKAYGTMSKKYSQYIDKIICNSYFERSLLTINQCPLEKMVVIYNCIENQIPTRDRYSIRNELGISENEFVLGSIGRFAWVKGFSHLLEAATEVMQDFQDFRILLVGDGPEMPHIREMVLRNGISNRVILTGMRRDIPDMLAAMDVFAIPSLWEAFGNTTVEAMYAKRLVLASRVGGIPEVIQDEVNGFLLPAAEKQPWIDKIKYVYEHYRELSYLTEQAFIDACDRYNFDLYYEKILKVYKEEDL